MTTLIQGDCLELFKNIPNNSIDLIFTDPPYALGSKIIIKQNGQPDYQLAVDFMNKWEMPDGNFWQEWYSEAFRVLKYGGHCAMFGIDRQTFLFQYYAVLNGFIPKQSLYWYFISNFPKASDLSKNIDKRFRLEREVVGYKTTPDGKSYLKRNKEGRGDDYGDLYGNYNLNNGEITLPNHPLAQKYNGYKYSVAPLKQTCEEIMVFQKPYKHGSCLNDVLAYEEGDESITVGALDIEGNRVGTEGGTQKRDSYQNLKENENYHSSARLNFNKALNTGTIESINAGRYPAQTFIDSFAGAVLDRQSGKMGMHPAGNKKEVAERDYNASSYKFGTFKHNPNYYNDTKESAGKCSRILHKCDYEDRDFDLMVYCPKVSKSERNEGLEGFEEKDKTRFGSGGRTKTDGVWVETHSERKLFANNHPTVKPTKLLSHILKLFKTPNQQIILDPFMGSGSMGISAIESGYDFIGFELDSDYFKIAEARITHAEKKQPII